MEVLVEQARHHHLMVAAETKERPHRYIVLHVGNRLKYPFPLALGAKILLE